ncbi:MAG: type II secretion system F family protein [Fimbriimonadaceae bacterium]|nr:type II secretion system F family protein [Fimbriimonadaceae bacterium]
MPLFSYQALDRAGSPADGTVTANDTRAATVQIQALGLFPLEVRAAGGSRDVSLGSSVKRRGRRVKQADLTMFTRQLANLVAGGLPILRTLDALIDNTENARLFEVLSGVREEVARGESLAASLGAHPRIFSSLYVSLVSAGEASGELAGVLTRLADFLEQDLERRSQIRAALMYPGLLVTVGGLVIFGMVTFLIPKFRVLFEEVDRALPLTTQLVLAVSDFLRYRGWALALALAVLWFLHRQWLRTPAGRLRWDRWRLRWPLLGRLQHRSATARLARTLATLLRGGVSILDALSQVEGVVDNACLAQALRQIRDGVREGESLGHETRKTGAYPALLAQMMLVGEETGDVEGALNTVADAFDVEVANALKGLIALVEPLIILVMGGVVAVVVFAMLMPIFQMNAGLG